MTIPTLVDTTTTVFITLCLAASICIVAHGLCLALDALVARRQSTPGTVVSVHFQPAWMDPGTRVAARGVLPMTAFVPESWSVFVACPEGLGEVCMRHLPESLRTPGVAVLAHTTRGFLFNRFIVRSIEAA